MGAPEPEEIYERTREEGRRRLERPSLELVSTALAAGFDILAGVVLLCLLESQLSQHFGTHAAHVAGALEFGRRGTWPRTSTRTAGCRSS